MMSKKVTLLMFLFIILFGACSNSSQQAQTQRIKTLLITGQNISHNWKLSSQALQNILEKSELFSVDVAVSPNRGEDMSPFVSDFKNYKLVVIDYNGDEWCEEMNRNFLNFVSQGGGVVIYHAGNNPFPNWKEYNEMTALGGWFGRDEKAGPYLYWKDGQLTKDFSPGIGGSHGNRHQYVLTSRNQNHPITKGLPEQWLHATDELYDRMRGPANVSDLLYTAYSDTLTKGSGREEPLIFTVNYAKGRVFHTMLGHVGESDTNDVAIRCVGFQTTLLRGAEWAATGAVSQAIPADFPDKENVKLR